MNQLVFVYPKDDNELYHHGVKGQSWGIRRYQNEDGTLTELGRQRLGYENNPDKAKKELEKVNKKLEFHKKYAAGPSYSTFKVLRKHSEKKAQQLEKRKNMLEKVKDFASDDMNDLKEEAAKALNTVGTKMASAADKMNKNNDRQAEQDLQNKKNYEVFKKKENELNKMEKQENVNSDPEKVKQSKQMFDEANRNGKKGIELSDKIFKKYGDQINKIYRETSWENKNSKYISSDGKNFNFDKWQSDSCKKLLKTMNLPVTKESMLFLMERIFTGDD